MPQSLEIQIKTLTPLWTGGVNGTCDELHISGLMGSLRYWYEAIVRGVGGYACDPSEGGCVYNKEGTKSICAACYLFGTTGWARLFRLSLKGAPPRIEDSRKGVPAGKRFSLHFLFRPIPPKIQFDDADYPKAQIKNLLWLIDRFGGLGARQQKRFGQVAITLENDSWPDPRIEIARLSNYPSHRDYDDNDPEWPDLQHFFSFIVMGDQKPHPVEAPPERWKIKQGREVRTESPFKNSAIRTWFGKAFEASGQDAVRETCDILFGKKSNDENEKRSSRICVNLIDPRFSISRRFELHLYGFGIRGKEILRQPLDGIGMQHLFERYIQNCWPEARIDRQWEDSLLPRRAQA
jgi:hypothetical protein